MHSSIVNLQDTYTDPDWHAFLEFIRTQNSRSETTVEQAIEALDTATTQNEWTRDDILECFKEMKAWGFATMTKGARGKKTRLEWLFPPRLIADAAMGQAAELEKLIDGITNDAPSANTNPYVGKAHWHTEEIMIVLSELSGVTADNIKIHLTIPEARQILAKSLGIDLNEINIRMGV